MDESIQPWIFDIGLITELDSNDSKSQPGPLSIQLMASLGFG